KRFERYKYSYFIKITRNQSAFTVPLPVRLPARIDCKGGAAQLSHTASDLRGDMASCAGALADRPRLVLKKIYVRNKIWKYFGYEAECEGKPIEIGRESL